MKTDFKIIDTTLRDGLQAPGVVMHLNEKLHIASLLDKIGIRELEIGTPAIGALEIRDMKSITGSGFGFKTISWCRATKIDIDKAIQASTNGVNISFPISDIHLLAMGKDRKWIFQTLCDLTKYAKENFEYFTIGLQDASRSDFGFLNEVIDMAIKSGTTRIRYADTVGVMNPLQVANVFKKLCKLFPIANFEFHGHNDLGMATANTLMAMLSGANSASVTVNGLGERAGNAALEELVIAIMLSTNKKLYLDTTCLGELSHYVSKVSGVTIPVNKPITGFKSLCHESGIHTNLMLKNRNTYQIIEAVTIGCQEKQFVFGKHTGKAALMDFIIKKKITVPVSEIPEILNKLKDNSYRLKRELTEDEVLALMIVNNKL